MDPYNHNYFSLNAGYEYRMKRFGIKGEFSYSWSDVTKNNIFPTINNEFSDLNHKDISVRLTLNYVLFRK